jgi:hypothetical protein
MNIDSNRIMDLVFKVGSLAGLFALIFQIHTNRKNRPRILFTFESSYSSVYTENKMDFCNFHFGGIIRNQSLRPNTAVRLYLTVWANRRRHHVLRFGHTVSALKDAKKANDFTDLNLPLYLKAKEALKVEVTFNFPITGTSDEKIMREVVKISETLELYMPKYRYEFLIEDTAGNLFDFTNAKLVSRELIDLWWTLPNYSKRPARYILEVLRILYKFIAFQISRATTAVGFYK